MNCNCEIIAVFFPISLSESICVLPGRRCLMNGNFCPSLDPGVILIVFRLMCLAIEAHNMKHSHFHMAVIFGFEYRLLFFPPQIVMQRRGMVKEMCQRRTVINVFVPYVCCSAQRLEAGIIINAAAAAAVCVITETKQSEIFLRNRRFIFSQPTA